MKIKYYIYAAILLLSTFLTGCNGGGGSTSGIASEPTTPNVISGVVDDDPVAGAEVYIDFGDGTTSTKVLTDATGYYELELSAADLAKINPEVEEGTDGPRDNLLLVAKKDNRELRNALSRDVAEGQNVYITNDTEAYAQYLESIDKFDTITLTEFNTELVQGRIQDSSEKADFIKDIREDVKTYFYGGEKPTSSALFSKAIMHLGADKLALIADDSSYVTARSVMSGGDVTLPANLTVTSDDITITNKGSGRYTVGSGDDAAQTAYLQVQNPDSNTFKLIPLQIKLKLGL